jgi:hypothetical protein
VPPYKGSEGGLIALRREALHELRIGWLGGAMRPGQPPEVLKDKASLCVGHGLVSQQATRFAC